MAGLTHKIVNIVFGDIASRLSNFIVSIYLARILGAEGFGLITIALSFLGYFVFFSDFGLYNIGVREIAKPNEKKLFNSKEILFLRVTFSVIVFVLAFLIVPFLSFSKLQISLILGFVYTVIVHGFLIEWYFNGTQEYLKMALSNGLRGLSYLLLVLFFVRSVDDILYVPYAYTISISVSAIMLFFFAFRTDAFAVKLQGMQNLKKLFKATSKIGGGSFFTNILDLLPPILIGYFISTYDAGIYGAALKMIVILRLFDRILVNLLIPNFSKYWSISQKEAIDQLLKACRLTLGFGAILSLGFAVGSPDFTMWIFGNEFQESIPLVMILSAMAFFTLQNSIYSFGLISMNKDSEFFKSTITSGFVSVALIVGASKFFDVHMVAIAVVLSEMTVTGISYIWFSRFVQTRMLLPNLITILAGLFIFWLTSITGFTPWIEALLASTLVFVILLVTNVFRRDDIVWLYKKMVA